MPSPLTLHVEHSVDDGQQIGEKGSATLAEETILSEGATKTIVAFRFPNVTIPNGSKLTKAVFSIWVPAGTVAGKRKMEGLLGVNRLGATSPNAPEFKPIEEDFSGGTNWDTGGKTTPTPEWKKTLTAGVYNSIEIGEGTGEQAKASMATLLNLLIEQSGWESGSAIAVRIFPLSTALCTIEAWDKEKGSAHSAKLELTYTEPVLTAKHLAMMV